MSRTAHSCEASLPDKVPDKVSDIANFGRAHAGDAGSPFDRDTADPSRRTRELVISVNVIIARKFVPRDIEELPERSFSHLSLTRYQAEIDGARFEREHSIKATCI